MTDETGRFEILGELGRGGMATVYLARDRVREERVALKVLHPHLADDSEARERLVREVRVTSGLRHPHILAPFEVHEEEGRLALSMPLHRGRTLADHLAMDGPLSPEALQRLADDLAGALAAAHAQGVLHRDLTPANVLIGEPDGTMLTDFGLARLENQATATRTAALGTVGFAAPEVYGGERADPRSDLYALGCVLYQAATGQPPWGGGAPLAVLKRQLDGDRPSLASQRQDLDPKLVNIIERCMDPTRSLRPPSAREVQAALESPDGLLEPVVAVAPGEVTGLPRGMHTVIVAERADDRRRRRQLRRSHNAVSLDPQAERERSLARAVAELARAPELEPSDAMKHPEFKLVEAVDMQTAERIAALAIDHGYAPRIADDPHVRWSRRLGQPHLAAGLLLSVLAFVLFTTGMDEGSLLAVALSPAVLLAATWLAWRFRYLRTLRAALPGLTPGVSRFPTPARSREAPETELGEVLQRVTDQLDHLERCLDEQAAGLPPAAVQELSALLGSLTDRSERMGREAERLRRSLEATPLEDAHARLSAQLKRLQTMQDAGEQDAGAEITRIRAALDEVSGVSAARDEAEAHYTRLLARLLEIGAAAARAARQLGGGEAAGSVSDLLERLGETANLARATREELDGVRRGERGASSAHH